MANYIPKRFDNDIRNGICPSPVENAEPVIDRVFRGPNGLLKVGQLHDTRFNLVLPEQLMDVFTMITTNHFGSRSKSEVVEHLMLGFCEAYGVKLNEFQSRLIQTEKEEN